MPDMPGRVHFVSYVSQNLLSGPKHPSRLEVQHFSRRNAGDAVAWLLDEKFPWRQQPIPIGITLDQNSNQQITNIALATSTRAVAIGIDESSPRDLKLISGDGPFVSIMKGRGKFLCKNPVPGEEQTSMNTFVLVGFDFAQLAVLVRKYVGIEVRGVDMGTLIAPNEMVPWSPGRMTRARVDQNANSFTIDKCWYLRVDEEAFFMRAWVPHYLAERCQAEIASATHVATEKLNRKELECLENMVAERFWLDQLLPKDTANEFTKVTTGKDGRLEVHNQTYKNKIRRSEHQAVQIIDTAGREHITRARGVKGKSTTLGKLNLSGEAPVSIRIVGRQDRTNSERLADLLLLSVLQGTKSFQKSPFIRLFWFPTWKKFRPPEDTAILRPERLEAVLRVAKLNASQEAVVKMAEKGERCVIVHGPPGTGKTTTIAAIARIWDVHDCPVWITAHSNVAVKNIALALHKREVGFRIIVSKEFYEEWHEHLYDEIRDRLIRSDELPESPIDLERMLGETCIILSTLGMLSNPALDERGLFREVPVERLIVDEASQIRVFEFLVILPTSRLGRRANYSSHLQHLFEMFDNLEKVFFFGDPCQLPPYKSEDIRGMKTVFDLEHLNQPQRKRMLNVQYRMPVPLGSFVSTIVYQGKLNSVHSTTSSDCVLFVDVPAPHGAEMKVETSWRNEGEVRTVVQLIKSYYKHLDFAVVTPYDGQRGLIERALQAEDLPWENAVFNIDSFQGNERDYIIISLVRTNRPGFLTSLNRLNVMLTRCKKGMVIVANRVFLSTTGSATLVARFASYWKNSFGHASVWVDWKDIANGSIDAPGAPAFNPRHRMSATMPSSNIGYSGVLGMAGSGVSRVPTKYQGSSGGFNVSKLFAKAQPKVQASCYTQHQSPAATKDEGEDIFDEWDEFGSYQEDEVHPLLLSASQATPQSIPSQGGNVQRVPDITDASAFPSLVSMSTEDELRLNQSASRFPNSSGWHRPLHTAQSSTQMPSSRQASATWLSSPLSATSSMPYAKATPGWTAAPAIGFNPMVLNPPISRLADWTAYDPQNDDIPEFNPDEFESSFATWAASSTTDSAASTKASRKKQTSITRSPTVPQPRPTPTPTYSASVSRLDDHDDGGGWTRVERRRGHGRSRAFTSAVNLTKSQSPAVNGGPTKKKSRGYRYWVGLD
ncbi:hypothetical protein NMY22_g4833 [Coprinellus aureogranulatus]|nr:hypothetical protein NMY22_g4833 [Coprinellus aureogranulatus]